ncbi:MAG TPA: hypothetical protein VN436_13295 [Holophaga sp.]|nr:hypothetical protein [Holophaga sp.]
METLVRMESETIRAGAPAAQVRYDISTLPMDQVDVITPRACSCWGIENQLPWVLDVAFKEDTSRTRKGNGTECGAILRHTVLALLRQDLTPAGSIKYRRMMTAMSPEYRIAALLGFPEAPSRHVLA